MLPFFLPSPYFLLRRAEVQRHYSFFFFIFGLLALSSIPLFLISLFLSFAIDSISLFFSSLPFVFLLSTASCEGSGTFQFFVFIFSLITWASLVVLCEIVNKLGIQSKSGSSDEKRHEKSRWGKRWKCYSSQTHIITENADPILRFLSIYSTSHFPCPLFRSSGLPPAFTPFPTP